MAWTAGNVPDLSGQCAVVTGANSGIGYYVTKGFAASGATVVMACRNMERAEHAQHKLKREVSDADLRIELLDLASLDSIARFTERMKGAIPGVNLLINNAGIMGIPRRETADGFEQQMGVNHLGHFALTGRLLDHIRPDARIVTVSSEMHRRGEIDLTDLQSQSDYDPWQTYADSKLANLLFAFELNRRLEATGRDVLSVATHPGYAATRLQQRSTRHSWLQSGLMRLSNRILAQSAEKGARPVLYGATAPPVAGGRYYGPVGLWNMRGDLAELTPSSQSKDLDTARILWDSCEELTGVVYDLPE